MIKQCISLTALGMVIIASSGCASTHIARDFGVANEHNIDQQTINPMAYTNEVEQSLSGEKAQKVIDGYINEKTSNKNQRLLKDISND